MTALSDTWLNDAADLAGPADEADRIYHALRSAISGGELGPGQRLASERTLAADLRAPRAAVRRALQRLEAEGIVERGIGRAGSRVRAPQFDGAQRPSRDVSPQDVLEARWAVEPGFVPLIVARATEADFDAMEQKLRAMAGATTQQLFRQTGYEFHLELARATRNPLLIEIFELIIEARAKAGWGRLVELNATKEQQAVQIGRNRAALEALRERDVVKATALIRSHLATMVDEVLRGRSS